MLGIVVVFHLCVLSGLVPNDIVWGGKFQSVSQLLKFEIASVIINVFMILVVAIKGQYLGVYLPVKILDIFLWLMTFIFALNTIGNLFANTLTETVIFTPITFILAVLCFRVAKG
ncbi:MAG: hypothetical protein OEV74_20095 [Cyclobacteriaceae bacterium]|nr:hypothetical protein [Cyclobacteriaceae bacterium]MDH4298585.1 hypothetical protein [Cyclobacteriaceae bacterium]MDH5251132.1 hypothetical protein [Cyclobacteriaceae bacterium]